MLFVEGEHDLLVLRRYFHADLEGAGITLIPMRGAGNLQSIAALEFLKALLVDLPVAAMLDNARASAFNLRPQDHTPEEQSLVLLVQEMEEQGRSVERLLLGKPDIIAYLNEDAVRLHHPRFADWDSVIQDYRVRKAHKLQEVASERAPCPHRDHPGHRPDLDDHERAPDGT